MLSRLKSFGLPRTLPAATRSLSSPTHLVAYPYFVPRNTRGSLPIYTDLRNGGTRQLVLIRNVDGDLSALAKELSETLFPQNSPEASKMKITINHSKHLVIQGGQKANIMEWFMKKGF